MVSSYNMNTKDSLFFRVKSTNALATLVNTMVTVTTVSLVTSVSAEMDLQVKCLNVSSHRFKTNEGDKTGIYLA